MSLIDSKAPPFGKQESHRAAGQGSITLVGAGPGDPDLMTVKAVKALQDADVILYDDLVAPAILDLAPASARLVLVGKRGHRPSILQSEINEHLLLLAARGERVVRLKGGDPMIFGRAGEEMSAAQAAGIPVAVVPGITAAQAAAARLQVSLTHRDRARRLQYLTAHAKNGRLPEDICWPALADPVVTTVVYMPKHTIRELVATAIANGIDPAMPAIAMADVTRESEELIPAVLSELPEKLKAAAPEGPVLVLIGRVLSDLTPDR